MTLKKYQKKRNLKTSLEPPATLRKKRGPQLSFVIQEHHARRLHYDLRLEVEGVLKSWAVPKEIPLTPSVKRLAVQVEDHPYDYKDFEGTIPSGYGAGTVSIWDQGTYSVDGADAAASEKAMLQGLKKGVIHFTLAGKRLKDSFYMVRLNKGGSKNQWLLMKKKKEKEPASRATLSNVDKIFWPKEKITKGDMLQYYSAVAPYLLPHLKDCPMSLKRFPNGIEGGSFFQKNLESHPDWIETTAIQHKDKTVHYLLVQNEESLLYAANLGCIEFHPFFSRIKKPGNPNFVLLDLDPKGASFQDVIQVAQEIHRLLDEVEVPCYCKTSGATGLHIAIPFGAKYTYAQGKQFAELIAIMVSRKLPKISTLERSLSKRGGKVYIDFQQNDFGKTAVAPYSLRARPGAPVSTPLQWSEVKKGLDPKKLTMKTVLTRLKKFGDLFAPVLEKGIDLSAALRNLELL